MHTHELQDWQHHHAYGVELYSHAEKRTKQVIVLTSIMMVGEIIAGLAFRSMALLADGWHMGTHAAALGISVFAYAYARRYARDDRYSFGTGKVGALGGFASAIALAVVALLVMGESLWRLTSPVSIRFDEAIGVAVLGLGVNLACAYMLQGRDDHHEHHVDGGSSDEMGHHHHHEHHDHNLRAAYLHVLADALTSVFAIVALVSGKYFGWAWMDPVMGVVGALVIAKWSYGLLRDTSRVLLDAEASRELRGAVRETIEADADNRVSDLHLWRVGPRHFAAIVSVVTSAPKETAHYKELLSSKHADLAHITVEIHRCERPA